MSATSSAPLDGARRSATFPTRLHRPANSPDEPHDSAQDGAETLFAHPAVKIVSFSAPATARFGSVGGSLAPQDVEKLPWASRSERVIAIGPLRLYRLRNGTSFLNSGSILLSMLPKSQCWCVDGQSKFAIKLQQVIYRVELPFENDADKEKVEDFKVALGKMIQYEKTLCPFKRSFTVELPEEPDSPLRRRLIGTFEKIENRELGEVKRQEKAQRRWTPRSESRQDISDDDLASSPGVEEDDDAHPHQPGLQTKDTETTIGAPSEGARSVSAPMQMSSQAPDPAIESAEREAQSTSEEIKQETSTEEVVETASDRPQPEIEASTSSSASSHSSTDDVPDISLTQTISKPESFTAIQPKSELDAGNDDDTSSADQTNLTITAVPLSLEEVEEDESPPQADPEASSSESTSPDDSLPQSDSVSEVDIPEPTAAPTRSIEEQQQQEEPQPSPIEEPPGPAEVAEDPPSAPEPTASDPPPTIPPSLSSAASAHSPTLPPLRSATSVSSSTVSATATSSRSGGGGRRRRRNGDENSYLISKTFNLLLGPPSGLVSIMVQIARRVGNGVLRGAGGAGGYRLKLGEMPGRWEDSEEDEEEGEEDSAEREETSDEEDDYGVPLGNDEPSRRDRQRLGVASAEDAEE